MEAAQPNASRSAAAEENERRAREALPKLVRLLVDRYGARRVVLIGSLARGDFRESSDLDLMVEGVGFLEALDAWNEACDLAGLPVDLLRAENLSPGWRAHHDKYGRVLHG